MEASVTLREARSCNHCGFVMKAGLSYLSALHHIRYCSKNPQCKVMWCFACKVRFRGMEGFRVHIASRDHRVAVGAEDPSQRLERPKKTKKPREEGMEKNERAKENWKKSSDPWGTAQACPSSSDFFGVRGRRFNVIVADPPWGFDRRWTKSSALHHYPTMKDDDIYALPVGQLADENCMLLVWATSSKLDVAVKAIEKWGFTFKIMFMVWIKIFPKSKNPVCGLGNYTRGCMEPLLMASRGRITPFRAARDVSQLLADEMRELIVDGEHSPHVLVEARRAHSQKPEQFWIALERYLGENGPTLSKIELFSRKPRDGWHSWGNEANRSG